MIGSLDGKVELLDNPYAIINVNGVGYRVLFYNVLFGKLKQEEKIKIFTYTHVREDALELFGFENFADLKLFEMLITVSGVGPKTAMNIFSFGDHKTIVNAIKDGNVNFFASIPRLGRKNAQKIIIELKSKLGAVGDLDLSEEGKKDSQEIIAALKTFGFLTKEAEEAFKAVKEKTENTEERIRLALKYLAK